MASDPELVREELRDGDEIGSHTYTHANLATAGWREDFELTLTQNALAGTAAFARACCAQPAHPVCPRNQASPTPASPPRSTRASGPPDDLLVLVDGDTVFEPDAVGRLIQPLADPAVGAVSGNTKVANRRGLLGGWQHLEYVIGFNLDRRMFDVLDGMPTVPGAIGAFRRAALAGVGGVSTDTLAEDTDLTMALCRAGWRVVYEPAAIAWTEAPSSLRQLWRQRYRWCYGTMQAMWKHRRAVIERGPSGRFGRRGLTYLALFHVLLPLIAPVVDVFAIYGLLFLPRSRSPRSGSRSSLLQAPPPRTRCGWTGNG